MRRVWKPGVGWFLLTGFLAAWLSGGCTMSVEKHRRSDGTDIRNQQLVLEVEVEGDLSAYRTRATFTYEVQDADQEGIYFVFPGVDDPSGLQVILDGQALDASALTAEPHPLYSGDVFRLPSGSDAQAKGAHTLAVEGPWLPNDEAYFARWGGWHPYLGDRAEPVPITLEVTTPSDLRVVASGRRTTESISGGARISRWATRNPQGWVFLAVGDYTETVLVEQGRPFRIWAPANIQKLDPSAIVDEPFRVLRFLEEKLGAASIDTVGWVFIPEEEVTNFSIDGLLVGSAGTADQVSSSPEYLRGFLSHELAHYWFGDLVRGHRDGARWISEGFAEYWRYRYEDAVGAEPLPWAYRNQILLRRFGAGEMPTLMDEARGEDEAIYYQKGSFVLYMLERRLGRELLDEAMRRFVDRFRGESVVPSQFFSVVEEVAGEDFSWFAEQWLERPRGPLLSISEVRVRPQGTRFVVAVEVRQEEPTYRLELPIMIRTEDGRDHVYQRTIRKAQNTFTLEVEGRPERLQLDPDTQIFKWFPTEALPVDFALFREELLNGGSYWLGGLGEGDSSFGEWSAVKGWLEDQFGTERMAEDRDEATHIILLGNEAARARQELAAGLAAPSEGTIQAFVRRDPADPARLMVGIEGTVPRSMPPIIPEAPLSFIIFRDGSMVGAHAAALPTLSRELEVSSPELGDTP